MKKKVYIETTIPSIYFNKRTAPEMVARCNWTREWWDDRRVEYDLYTGAAVIDELRRADHPDRDEKLALLRNVAILPMNLNILDIVQSYIDRLIMPRDPSGDALHLALASFYGLDILLTWNCKHLANFRKFEHIEKVNRELNLGIPRLLTPLELLGDNPL